MKSAAMRSTPRNHRNASHGAADKRRQKKPVEKPQLILIANDQEIIDKLDDQGLKPRAVTVRRERYFNAYRVSYEQARAWCEKCRQALCTCPDKFHAPFMLARFRAGKPGEHAVFLRRKELPINIPAQRAA